MWCHIHYLYLAPQRPPVSHEQWCQDTHNMDKHTSGFCTMSSSSLSLVLGSSSVLDEEERIISLQMDCVFKFTGIWTEDDTGVVEKAGTCWADAQAEYRGGLDEKAESCEAWCSTGWVEALVAGTNADIYGLVFMVSASASTIKTKDLQFYQAKQGWKRSAMLNLVVEEWRLCKCSGNQHCHMAWWWDDRH